MKKMVLIAGIFAATIPLTGCFESEEEKAIRQAATETISEHSPGHYVSSVEITGETVEPVRGHTLTTRNFIAEVAPHDDAVVVHYRGLGYALVTDASGEHFKAAGVFQHVTDGVKSESDIEFNSRDSDGEALDRLSDITEKNYVAIYADSSEADKVAAELASKKQKAEAAIEANDKRRAEINAALDELSGWTYSDERNVLREAVYKAQDMLDDANDKIRDGVNKEFTAALQPYETKRNADLKKAKSLEDWRARNRARSAAYDAYRAKKDELNSKFLALYESRELKSSPELEAAQSALDKRDEEVSKRMAALDEERTKLWESTSKEESTVYKAEDYAQALESAREQAGNAKG